MVAMTSNTVQFPVGYDMIGRDGKITPQWYFFFKQYQAFIPPSGSGYVIDGSQATYGSTTIFQGQESNLPLSPPTGYVYIAVDTGNIFVSQAGSWVKQSPAFTGDVTKPAHSNTLTLSTVNYAPGTYGSTTDMPVITVDAKGRVTSIFTEPVTGLAPGGINGAVQFNSAGVLGGATGVGYNPATDALTFINRNATLNNLLPVQTGLAGQYLTTDGTNTSWVDTGVFELVFFYGDATPKPLFTIEANKRILSISIFITTAFDGIGASLSVGDASNYSSLMATSDILPNIESVWEVTPSVVYGTATPLFLSIVPGSGATAGAGLITITYSK